MSKADKIKQFNPNNPADDNSNIFGLPFNEEEASLVIVPLPWEVTVSYGAGTVNSPQAIFDASKQVDLFDPYIKDAWQIGIFMQPINQKWIEKNNELRNKAVQLIALITSGDIGHVHNEMEEHLKLINRGSFEFKEEIKAHVLSLINNNKIIIGLGGDHSTPLGIIEALATKFESFGILQLDAHCDLREAYEGFEYSHASIMYNALKQKQISKLVQVGIRDYCEEEMNYINNAEGRVVTFFDRDIKKMQYKGTTIDAIHEKIVAELPENIYLSFDVDALDPKLCPNTGTPVAGGFETEEVLCLIEKIIEKGKKIIAFDLNETGCNEWDANVSSRLLYRISNMVAKSNGLS